MRITAFIGAALVCLGMLAFAPVTMADPLPDICVLDLSHPVAVDHAVNVAGVTCAAVTVDVAAAVPIMPGDDDEAACPCMSKAHATFVIAVHRQHEDPGRCLG